MEIFHDGSNSIIDDTGQGGLVLRSDTSIALRKRTGDENQLVVNPDGAVELYHDNSKKFETTAEGIDVTGTVGGDQLNVSGVSTFAGNVDANGNLDVDGHTELDNVNIAGVLTATSAEFSGNVTVLGDLTYENVTNQDSIGIATARAGLRVTGGGLDVVGVATFNDNVNATTGNTYQINGVDVLSATTLGTGSY